jgi:putative ABC transport system permease protein
MELPLKPANRGWRQFTNALRLALDSIGAHKLRSFLTLLGVVIGVASVVLVGAAISGLGAYAEQSTSKAFGAESFLVAQIASVGRLSRREYIDKMTRNKPIREGDARFVEAVNGDRILYSPYRVHMSDVKRENLRCESTSIIGVAAAMAVIRDVGLSSGRFITDQEDHARMNVAVIGQTVVDTLFPGGSPLGGSVRIDGIDFTVVGVVERLGSSFGRDQDNAAYITDGSFSRLYGPGNGFPLFGRAKAGSGLSLAGAVDETRVALRTRFHARPGQDDPFDVMTPDAIRGFIDQVLGMVAAVVVPLTCMSLVVGGIVIMNIMLVSVTERTREIGVRKSVGARHSDIMLQVLIEAVALSIAGGVLGLGLGAAGSYGAAAALDFPMRVTPGYVVLAVLVSTIVGVASGWYPARRAARLDPVTALRAE